MAFSFARSLSSSVSRMSRRSVVARKYSSGAHHGAAEVGPVEKRVLRTRVVLPSPLGRSNLNPTNIVVPNVAEMEAQAEVTAKKQQEIMVDRLARFRQAILDAHEERGLEYESNLGPNEFPTGPLTLKGSFGTPDQPMLVPSFEQERLVGCQGGAGPRHHETLWHNLKKNKPLCCMDCGQIFRLVDHMEWLEWAATEWDVNKQDTIQFFLPEDH